MQMTQINHSRVTAGAFYDGASGAILGHAHTAAISSSNSTSTVTVVVEISLQPQISSSNAVPIVTWPNSCFARNTYHPKPGPRPPSYASLPPECYSQGMGCIARDRCRVPAPRGGGRRNELLLNSSRPSYLPPGNFCCAKPSNNPSVPVFIFPTSSTYFFFQKARLPAWRTSRAGQLSPNG